MEDVRQGGMIDKETELYEKDLSHKKEVLEELKKSERLSLPHQKAKFQKEIKSLEKRILQVQQNFEEYSNDRSKEQKEKGNNKLEQLGFTSKLPYYNFYTKDNVQVNIAKVFDKNDVIEDNSHSKVGYQVLIFNLPNGKIIKNFGSEESAIKFIKEHSDIKKKVSEYENMDVQELVALKKKLYPNPDIESPMSEHEKLLDKIIAQKFSEKNQETRMNRSERIKNALVDSITDEEPAIEPKTDKKGKGILYEFFTPEFVCKKMWDIAYLHGFTPDQTVLEPSLGSGNLIKDAPDKSKVTAFEVKREYLDMALTNYPGITNYNMAFETAFLEAPRYNSRLKKGVSWLGTDFGLVISNPPYGKATGYYKAIVKMSGQMEHWFILNTLKLLKKGGLGIYLIPSSFMRNGNTYNSVKKSIFEISELVTVYRLPNNLFAKTSIGTDIVVLRKK